VQKINLSEALGSFSEAWSPRILGSVNDTELKVAKLDGEFVWHHHDATDELFLVIEGTMEMRFRENGEERVLYMAPGELVVVPRNVEHCPVSYDGCSVVLAEARGTLNTGNAGGALTHEAKPI
jgi:mannose-6-phosphate isomerase-like protein (cupin superfamily)